MKPFDFRSAVMGARVQTRAGRMVASVKSYPGHPDDEQILVEFVDGKREWQQARGLWNEKEEYRERYKQAITAAHKHDIPLERTSRTWQWKLVGQGEVLDFVNFVYRIRS